MGALHLATEVASAAGFVRRRETAVASAEDEATPRLVTAFAEDSGHLLAVADFVAGAFSARHVSRRSCRRVIH